MVKVRRYDVMFALNKTLEHSENSFKKMSRQEQDTMSDFIYDVVCKYVDELSDTTHMVDDSVIISKEGYEECAVCHEPLSEMNIYRCHKKEGFFCQVHLMESCHTDRLFQRETLKHTVSILDRIESYFKTMRTIEHDKNVLYATDVSPKTVLKQIVDTFLKIETGGKFSGQI